MTFVADLPLLQRVLPVNSHKTDSVCLLALIVTDCVAHLDADCLKIQQKCHITGQKHWIAVFSLFDVVRLAC